MKFLPMRFICGGMSLTQRMNSAKSMPGQISSSCEGIFVPLLRRSLKMKITGRADVENKEFRTLLVANDRNMTSPSASRKKRGV